MSYEYKIATLAQGVVGLTLLSSLGVSFPSDNPVPYSVEFTLGDGGVRGGGWPIVDWHWDVIKVAQWNALRAYCTGKSSDVYIRTYEVNENQAFANYLAKMVWPTSRPFSAGRVLDFTIRFQALVLQV